MKPVFFFQVRQVKWDSPSNGKLKSIKKHVRPVISRKLGYHSTKSSYDGIFPCRVLCNEVRHRHSRPDDGVRRALCYGERGEEFSARNGVGARVRARRFSAPLLRASFSLAEGRNSPRTSPFGPRWRRRRSAEPASGNETEPPPPPDFSPPASSIRRFFEIGRASCRERV